MSLIFYRVIANNWAVRCQTRFGCVAEVLLPSLRISPSSSCAPSPCCTPPAASSPPASGALPEKTKNKKRQLFLLCSILLAVLRKTSRVGK